MTSSTVTEVVKGITIWVVVIAVGVGFVRYMQWDYERTPVLPPFPERCSVVDWDQLSESDRDSCAQLEYEQSRADDAEMQEFLARETQNELQLQAEACMPTNQNSNLRAGPGVDYPILGTVKAGACIPVSGQNSDGTWYWFQKEDVFGPGVDVWIRSYLVDNVPVNLPKVGATSKPAPAPVPSKPQAQDCAGGCTTYPTWCAGIPIKGNVSFDSGERIYHVAGQEYYDATKIDPAYDERWFCTEAEAQAAGWRKANK